MKPRLIILSDLFGFENSTWIQNYVNSLNKSFEITLYDSINLAEINKENISVDEVHRRFVNGGIDKAVENLLANEKGAINILGFSIGGTIAWKAGIEGLDIIKLIAVSSTRLRKETIKPSCKVNLIFAEKDAYSPNDDWFHKMEIQSIIIKNENHSFYSGKRNVSTIMKQLNA